MKIQPLCIYCSGEGCPACRETGVALDDAAQVTAIAEYNAAQKPILPKHELDDDEALAT